MSSQADAGYEVWVECSCGNEWWPRKPLRETTELLCSDCGAREDDAFSVRLGAKEPRSAVERARFERAKFEVGEGIARLFDAITDDGDLEEFTRHDGRWIADDQGLRSVATSPEIALELLELNADLATADDEAELSAIDDRVDELVEEVDKVDVHRSTLDRLDAEVADRRAERDELVDEVDELRADLTDAQEAVEEFEERQGMSLEEALEFTEKHEDLILTVDDLQERIDFLQPKFDDSMEKYQAHQNGIDEASERFGIKFQCAQCGGVGYVEKGWDVHAELQAHVNRKTIVHKFCRHPDVGIPIR